MITEFATVLIDEKQRITLRSYNIRDEGKFNRLLREGWDYLKRVYGDSNPPERDEDSLALTHRARMFASLHQYEELDEAGEWQPAELPRTWFEIETFFTDIPPRIYNPWWLAAMRLNGPPGIFEDDPKKNQSVTVAYLTSL